MPRRSLASADACAADATTSSVIELSAAHADVDAASHATKVKVSLKPAKRGKRITVREHVLRSTKVIAYVCAWYVVSITLTLYNKWLFAIYGLRFPLLITSLHIALKVPTCRLCMWLLSVPTVQWSGSRAKRVLFLEVMPAGIATAADIGLSNLSYLFITVTYYTIIKSSVPVWIMIFSALYGLLKIRASLVAVVLCIVGGIVLTTLHEDDSDDTSELSLYTIFNVTNVTNVTAANCVEDDGDTTTQKGSMAFLGAVLVLGASLSAGYRWAATQKLLTAREAPPGTPDKSKPDEESAPRRRRRRRTPYWEGLTPLTLLYYSSPFGFMVLLPLAVAHEWREFVDYVSCHEDGGILVQVALLASIGAFLAFFLILFELRVVQLSSGLTLSVAGILKEALTVGCSALLLGDRLTLWNVSGLSLCLVGIGMYNRIRLNEARAEQEREHQRAAADSASVLYVDDEDMAHVQPVDR